MKQVLFLIFIIIISLLQSTWFNFDLVFFGLIIWTWYEIDKNNLILLYLISAGLIVDLISGNILGRSSIIYLLLSLVIFLIKKFFKISLNRDIKLR